MALPFLAKKAHDKHKDKHKDKKAATPAAPASNGPYPAAVMAAKASPIEGDIFKKKKTILGGDQNG